jgi:hypothetical protein
MSYLIEIERCALCGGIAWMQEENGQPFQGEHGTTYGTEHYIQCAGATGPVNPETGDEDPDGDWKAWVECDADDCSTYDHQHGGQYGAGELPCKLKWNAMQVAIREFIALQQATPQAGKYVKSGGRL